MNFIDIVLASKLNSHGSGGAVSSVNGKTGNVVLTGADLAFSDSTTYPAGSIGYEINNLKEDPNNFIVNFDSSAEVDESGGLVPADKSFDEIIEAYTNHKNIVFRYEIDANGVFITINSTDYILKRQPIPNLDALMDIGLVTMTFEVMPAASMVMLATFMYSQEEEAWEMKPIILQGNLDAGSIGYDSTQSYRADTIGKAISDANAAIANIPPEENFIVTFDATTANSQNHTVQADKTMAEIVEAHTNHKNIIFQYIMDMNGSFLSYSSSDYFLVHEALSLPGADPVVVDTCLVNIALGSNSSSKITTLTFSYSSQEGAVWKTDKIESQESIFYGLALAAGDRTQASSNNIVGNYTESAKSAIYTMLNEPVTVSGTTPTITAKDGITYICGEVATLDITLPASGIFDVIFTSGTTPTVLTATGVTWPDWFDPTTLEANQTYELNIANGRGVVMSWAV